MKRSIRSYLLLRAGLLCGALGFLVVSSGHVLAQEGARSARVRNGRWGVVRQTWSRAPAQLPVNKARSIKQPSQFVGQGTGTVGGGNQTGGGGYGNGGFQGAGMVPRVQVAPGGFGNGGGIRFVTIPTPRLTTQVMARQFFQAGGIPFQTVTSANPALNPRN
jgi:hypothetical protein